MSDFLTFVITKHSRVDVELAYMEPDCYWNSPTCAYGTGNGLDFLCVLPFCSLGTNQNQKYKNFFANLMSINGSFVLVFISLIINKVDQVP